METLICLDSVVVVASVSVVSLPVVAAVLRAPVPCALAIGCDVS